MAGIELISDQGFRIDGRRANDLRKIVCHLGVFNQADGSSYLEQGNTRVLAAVYGPHETRGTSNKALDDRALVNCQYSQTTFSTADRKNRPRGDRKSCEMTIHMKQTFEAAIVSSLYPRSQIDIYVEVCFVLSCLLAGIYAYDVYYVHVYLDVTSKVLQADGGNFSACVNAATLALIDAGIPLKDYVCACSASFIRDTALVDLNHLEESGSNPELVIATLPKSNDQIVFLEINSRLHEDNLCDVVNCAVSGCQDIFQILQKAVRDNLSTFIGE